MVFSEGGTPFTVRVDFYKDAITFREKEGAVEEITSGDQIYQAYIDLVQATARKVFEHINPGTSRPAVLPAYPYRRQRRASAGHTAPAGAEVVA